MGPLVTEQGATVGKKVSLNGHAGAWGVRGVQIPWTFKKRPEARVDTSVLRSRICQDTYERGGNVERGHGKRLEIC